MLQTVSPWKNVQGNKAHQEPTHAMVSILRSPYTQSKHLPDSANTPDR
jgi:hypothetical protein